MVGALPLEDAMAHHAMASDVSCSRPSVCFVFLYFNIPRMFKLVFLQVVVLLDINTVFLDTSARGFNFFVLVFFLDCKERTFAWRAATLL